MPARHTRNAKKIVLVLAAISNAYFKPLTKDTELTATYTDRILNGLKEQTNELKPVCNGGGWSGVETKRSKYSTTREFLEKTDIIPDYDKKDVIELGMGKHGWNRSCRYIAHGFKKCEAMTQTGKNGRKHCIKFKNIVGRFASTKTKTPRKYVVCIDFGEDKNTKLKNIKWYCTCKTGNRTTNPCSHVIAVLRYCNLIKTNKLNSIESNYYNLLNSAILDCYKYVQETKKTGEYCKCKSTNENEWHIQCELCKEKYHPKCIKIPKSTLKQFVDNDITWWCPYCEEDDSDIESQSDVELDSESDIDIETDIQSNIDLDQMDNNLDLDGEPRPKRRRLANRKSSKSHVEPAVIDTENKRRTRRH